MESSFFTLISRMRHIGRWGLMRNSETENVQEHSHMVAVIAHAQAATGEISTEAMQLQMQFRNHLQALKAIHGIQDKAVLKAKILPEYAGYIDGILKARIRLRSHIYRILFCFTLCSNN